MYAPHPLLRRAAAASVLTATALAATLTASLPAHAGGATGHLGISRYNVHQGTVRHWSLTCEPDGGSHPAAREACARLGEINGDLDQIRFRPTAPCPNIYDPVHVEITGTWDGTAVVFHENYPNPCYLERLAGPIIP